MAVDEVVLEEVEVEMEVVVAVFRQLVSRLG